ncbi:MAG: hypothetical protein R6V58_17135 [Planctomycetota bacterium]
MTAAERVHAVLLHLTHYDPRWMEQKQDEKRFDRGLMEELVDLTPDCGYNTVIFDVADAVEYAIHPDLKRPYTVPMQELADLAGRARDRGLEVIGKLNWSKSERHRHNWWFRPYRDLPDDDEYFDHAWQVIDEVCAACGPGEFFHIGVDEDTTRDADAYCAVIERLRAGLAERGRRTVAWSDLCVRWSEDLASKAQAAAERLPRDIVLTIWHYSQADPDRLKTLVDLGYEVWCATGRKDTGVARQWREAVEDTGGHGLVTTVWDPTQPEFADNWRRVITESADGFGIR